MVGKWLCSLAVLAAVTVHRPALGQQWHPVNFSAKSNYALDPGVLGFTSAGLAPITGAPTGWVTLGGVPFVIPVDSTGNGRTWLSASAAFNGDNGPHSIVIPVNLANPVEVDTLINTWWGQPAPSYASLTFRFSDGSTYVKPLIGNFDIRDYNSGTFTNSINGTTTTNVVSLGNGHNRLDKQQIALPSAYQSKTLTSITLQDNGSDGFQRVFLAGVTVETKIPTVAYPYFAAISNFTGPTTGPPSAYGNFSVTRGSNYWDVTGQASGGLNFYYGSQPLDLSGIDNLMVDSGLYSGSVVPGSNDPLSMYFPFAGRFKIWASPLAGNKSGLNVVLLESGSSTDGTYFYAYYYQMTYDSNTGSYYSNDLDNPSYVLDVNNNYAYVGSGQSFAPDLSAVGSIQIQGLPYDTTPFKYRFYNFAIVPFASSVPPVPGAGSGSTTDQSGGSNAVYTGISGKTVVGYYNDASHTQHGFVWDGSTYNTLDYPSAAGTALIGVSGSNILGKYLDSVGWHGFLYNGSTFKTFPPVTTAFPTDIIEPLYGLPSAFEPMAISGNTVIGSYSYVGVPIPGYSQIFPDGIVGTIDKVFLEYKGNGYAANSANIPLDTYEVVGIDGSNITGFQPGGVPYVANGSTYTPISFPFGSLLTPENTWVNGISGSNVVGGYKLGSTNWAYCYDGTNFYTIDAPGDPVSISGNSILFAGGIETESGAPPLAFIDTIPAGGWSYPNAVHQGTVPNAPLQLGQLQIVSATAQAYYAKFATYYVTAIIGIKNVGTQAVFGTEITVGAWGIHGAVYGGPPIEGAPLTPITVDNPQPLVGFTGALDAGSTAYLQVTFGPMAAQAPVGASNAVTLSGYLHTTPPYQPDAFDPYVFFDETSPFRLSLRGVTVH